MNSRERFIAACRREQVDRHPVWLMRQAGRYLPEYREIREKYDLLTMFKKPDLIFEVSLQPWRRFEMDAVIVFSDILLPLQAMGVKLEFEEGSGPRLGTKILSDRDVKDLSIPNVRLSFSYLLDALQNISHELKDEIALLGFIGAPWTLACYLIEGGSGDFTSATKLLRESPGTVASLMEKLTTVVTPLAIEQIRSGAAAVQIFDTWGGLLDVESYRRYAVPHLKKVVEAVHRAGAPAILFVRRSLALIEPMIETGADVVSVGPDIDLREALKIAGPRCAIQGNLDPEVLLRSPSMVEMETRTMLEAAGKNMGYIANLGHGVMPGTPPESVGAFVGTVKKWTM